MCWHGTWIVRCKTEETNPDADDSQLSMPILMYDKEGKSTVMTLEQLLPMSFGPDKLLPTDEVTHGSLQ